MNQNKKNDWGELLGKIATGTLVVFNKDNAVVFRIDLIFALLISLFVTVILVLFILMILTENWYFEIETKAK